MGLYIGVPLFRDTTICGQDDHPERTPFEHRSCDVPMPMHQSLCGNTTNQSLSSKPAYLIAKALIEERERTCPASKSEHPKQKLALNSNSPKKLPKTKLLRAAVVGQPRGSKKTLAQPLIGLKEDLEAQLELEGSFVP